MNEGIIEKVNDESAIPGCVHYLPHRAVIRNDRETTKVSVVFDASAKLPKSPSLNENPEITVYRFLRVVFRLICSPFLLNATVKHHASKYSTKWKYFVEKFLRDLYVDDSTSGFHTVFGAYDFYLKAKSMMRDAGFDLQKWASNTSELMKKIEMNETHDFTPIGKHSTRKVLGITWGIKSDEIIFDFNDLVAEAFEKITTKRSILSISSKLFDPLGLLSPITIQLKLLFQLICFDKLPWDQEMPDSISDKWLKLVCQLRTLNKLVIPRQNIKVIKD